MTRYSELLAQAQANPHDADFHALRMAYTRTDLYAPYSQDAPTIQALHRALKTQDADAAIEAIDQLLAWNDLDIEAHMAADYVYLLCEEHVKSDYHRAFASGLIDALLATGTGRDFDSAFIVISVAEEYVVLRVLGLIPDGQRLVEREGHWFDVQTVRDPQTEQARDMYFNIDLPHGWQEDHLG